MFQVLRRVEKPRWTLMVMDHALGWAATSTFFDPVRQCGGGGGGGQGGSTCLVDDQDCAKRTE